MNKTNVFGQLVHHKIKIENLLHIRNQRISFRNNIHEQDFYQIREVIKFERII